MKPSKLMTPVLLCLLITACSGNSGFDDTGQEAPYVDNTASDEILDRVWQIQEYTDVYGSRASVSTETTYQFLFESGTDSLQAFIGCVNFSESTYTLNDGYIKFTLGASDTVLCINQTEPFSAQNGAIMSLIAGGEPAGSVPLMHSIVDGQLQLQSADGRILTLIQVPELMQQD